MCFKRKPWLGHYSGTREDWRIAYRAARILEWQGQEMPPGVPSLKWKAGLIVAFERHDYADPLTWPVTNRLELKGLIDQVAAD